MCAYSAFWAVADYLTLTVIHQCCKPKVLLSRGQEGSDVLPQAHSSITVTLQEVYQNIHTFSFRHAANGGQPR